MSRSTPGQPQKPLGKSSAPPRKSSRHSLAASRDHIARAGAQEEYGREVEAGQTRTNAVRRAACSVLKQDDFIQEIMQHVIQKPGSGLSGAELWKLARRVLLLQQEAKVFEAEVQDWCKKYPALERPMHTDLVSITERQEQRLEFWAKYRSQAEARDLPPSSVPPPAAPGQANVLGRGLPRDCTHASGGPLDTCGNFWGKADAKGAKSGRGNLRAQARASAKGEKRSVLAGLANAAVASSVDDSKKSAAPSEAHSLSWTRRAARDTCYNHKGWALGRRFREQALCLQESSSAPELLTVSAEQADEPEAEQERYLRLLPDIRGARAKLMFARVGEDDLDKRRHYGRKTAARWQEQMRTVVDDPDDPPDFSPVHTRESRHHKLSTGHEWEIPSVGSGTSKSLRKQRLEAQESKARRSKRAGFAQKSTSLPNLTTREAVSTLHRPRASINVGRKSKKGGGVDALPPIAGAFGEGWRDEANASDLHSSPTKRYVRACQHFGVLPTPSLPFVTGQSLKLKAGDRALVDSDLLAVAVMIRSMDRIEEVDLEDNTLLTEKALVVFLRKLFGKPASSSLERLSIKRCLHAGRGDALEIIVQLLSEPDGLHNLRHLDLSGVPLSTRGHMALCNAIWGHPALNSVSLADTGLGNGLFTEQCVAMLLSSGVLQSLDIGWNAFNTEAFVKIGEQMVGSQALQSLSLANCSAMSDNAGNTSMLYFLEQLAHNRSLTFLDISLNRIDFKGALVIEDALEYHAGLAKINIAHNPLGIVGIRSFFRLLARGSSRLVQLVCDGCCAVKHPTPPDAQLFQVTRPARRYSLDLCEPYDRALLRMLYKTCERLNVRPSDAFVQVQSTPSLVEHPHRKDTSGLWRVPLEGTLIADFSLCNRIACDHQDMSDSEFIKQFDEHVSLTKVHVESHKAVALLALWHSMEGRVKEQHVMVDAMSSSDLVFGYPLLEQFCKNHPFVSEIVSCLMPCLTGGAAARHLSTLLAPTLEEQLALHKRLSSFRELNIENPTGHYQLDLGDGLQAAVGERLLCLDSWEALLAQQQQLEDTSQKGNYSQIRNEEYQNSPLNVPMVASWALPNHGGLKFDYVSNRRPPPDASELRQDAFLQLLIALRQSNISLRDQVKALRQVSSQVYLTCMQLRALMVNVGDRFVAEELAVIFFMRIIDMWNQKQFRVRCHDADALAHRLGYITSFPFLQPENCDFEIDFAVYEQRLMGKILAGLLAKEPNTSMQNPSYILPDGKKDLLTNGVPRMWAQAPPCSGIFRGKYICSPDDRRVSERQRLFETYGHWTFGTSEVTWWTGLAEVPEEVILYLQVVIGKFHELSHVFQKIDGLDGNGAVSLREFEESVYELNSPKFRDNAVGKRRMLVVYRFLDSNFGGEISIKEWMVLEQVWREMTSSIAEFIEGLQRAFHGNFAAAWQELDTDGNGKLDEEEWCAGVERVGYFGPAKVVFQFLDKEGAGTVSKPQFLKLRSFRKSPYKHRGAVVQSAKLPNFEAA